MKKYFTAAILVLIVAVFTTCKKEPDAPVGGNKIEMGETEVDNVSYFEAQVSSALANTGGNEISQHGHCWSAKSKPTTDNAKTTLGKLDKPDAFTSQLSELNDNTFYYIRSYVTYPHGTVYGTEENIKTLKTGKPLVNTIEVSNVTLYSAQCSGDVLADSGLFVVTRGICWDTNHVFTIADCLDTTIIGSGTGSFISNVTALNEGVKYFVKAYAINEKGTSYGDVKQFTTVPVTLPEVTTTDITEITANSATSGGNVTSNGNGTVTSIGVCWNTSGNPTLENNLGFTNNGEGTGDFTSNVYGLTDNTTYYVTAYATNEKGTSYGEVFEFTTLEIVLPEVTTSNISNLTMYAATSGGDVTSDGNGIITARGVCWSSTHNPTLANNHTADGNGTGVFESNITGLSPTTQYFARAYAVNSSGTAYGNEISFTTLSNAILPSVTTDEVTDITQTTATGGGNVTSDGGGTVSARGICWSTSSNPTLSDNFTTDGTGTGKFISNITGLTQNTTYFVRAYATNGEGTAYGNQVSFNSLPDPVLPTVTTDAASNITQTTANSGGNVTSDGGADVTARGVCWSSTNVYPDLESSHTTDGTGTGVFISLLTGLTPNTFYYVRAYATNSVGTTYGNTQTLMTLDTPTIPTVTTAEATNITQTEATTGGTVHANGGAAVTARGVCYSTTPNPTLSNSFTTNGNGLGTFVSILAALTPNTQYYVRAYATNSEGTAYGNEITFITLSDVTLPTVTTDEATNITQTTATSGGEVTDDGGPDVTARGVCWSISSEPTLSDNYTTNGSGTGPFVSELTGLSANTQYYVRAYATNSEGTAYGNEITFTTLTEPVIPTVTTDNATNITDATATSGGNVTDDGGADVTERGVCWSTDPDPTTADDHTVNGSGTGTFVSELSGLTANTLYYVRAYATNSVGTAYGNEISFTTLPPPWQCGDQITYEGQVYNTVEIGSQCWMKENLNVGTRIDGTEDMQDNQLIEKYCYDDDEDNCDTYGGLYQWNEMMQYVTNEGTQGICPDGWHIPTDDEWKTMEMVLGMTQAQADATGWRGTDEGGKMKETGTTHWNSPNTGATNSSGFTALPGGGRGISGSFYDLGVGGRWWSSTESSGSSAWDRYLYFDYAQVRRGYSDKAYGFSVRCLKN